VVISNAKRAQQQPSDDETTAVLTPAVFHILLALSDGNSHGYGIMQDVEAFTNGEIRLGPGTLYRSIQRMLVDGLIEELAIALHDELDDERRRHYRLTKKGLEIAQREARRLAALVDVARQRNLLARQRNLLARQRNLLVRRTGAPRPSPRKGGR
jgi:DNA-binding PadR family transcriptional regulator